MAYVLKVGPTLTTAGVVSDISLPDNTVVKLGQPLTVTFLTTDMISAIGKGYLTCTPAVPVTAVITNNVGGTAPTVTNGAVTFAAVVDVPSAANAINGLVVQVQALAAQVAALTGETGTLYETNRLNDYGVG